MRYDLLAIAGIIGALALGIYLEISVWNECRETHSWWYCVRTLNHN